MDDEVQTVYSYDCNNIWMDRSTVLYEVGHYLGGGAAGQVYECEHVKSRAHRALKILNPIGYKLLSPPLLRRCTIMTKGMLVSDSMEKQKDSLSIDHVWWVFNMSTKQYLAAYYSERNSSLREFSLAQCIQIWGSNPDSVGDDETGDSDETIEVLQTPNGPKIVLPAVPPKFAEFIRKRRRIFREINNMRKISNHANVIRLENVLELNQESKCTIFLVMELANGGELFDRIKIDCGTREDTAKFFFQQLLLGVQHCHAQGVCHRDLKPENLLLQDNADQSTILKIADFGFSARFAMGGGTPPSPDGDDWSGTLGPSGHGSRRVTTIASPSQESPLRLLKSVVGSPFYVAPEVLQATGYDGTKADIWSMGVILYAMLAGNLPFEQELVTCKRFKMFCKWVREQSGKGVCFWDDASLEYPPWLFPAKFSILAKGLIVAMLHPDPDERISVADAMSHPLVRGTDSDVSVDTDRSVATVVGGVMTDSQRGAAEEPPSCIQRDNSFNESMSTIDDDKTRQSAVDLVLPGSEAFDVGSVNGSAISAQPHSPIGPETVPPRKLDVMDNSDIDDDDDDRSTDFRDDDYDDDRDSLSADGDGNQFLMEEDIEAAKTEKSPRSRSSRQSSDSSSPSTRQSSSRSAVSNNCGHLDAGLGDRSSCISPAPNRSVNFAAQPTFTQSPQSPSSLQKNFLLSSPYGAGLHMPPPAPVLANSSIDNLLVNDDDGAILPSEASRVTRQRSGDSSLSDPTSPTEPVTPSNPPSFSDHVKRSTRFLTSVPAADVLEKVQSVLEQFRCEKTQTPIGIIGRVEVYWDSFRLEVWGQGDLAGPPVCALQLYLMPPALPSLSASPSRPISGEITGGIYSSPFAATIIDSTMSRPGAFPDFETAGGFGSMIHMGGGGAGSFGARFESPPQINCLATQDLFLVEFVRGQLDFFSFKRFYQLIRQRLSELVKRDYTLNQFDPAVSPMVDSGLLQRFQHFR